MANSISLPSSSNSVPSRSHERRAASHSYRRSMAPRQCRRYIPTPKIPRQAPPCREEFPISTWADCEAALGAAAKAAPLTPAASRRQSPIFSAVCGSYRETGRKSKWPALRRLCRKGRASPSLPVPASTSAAAPALRGFVGLRLWIPGPSMLLVECQAHWPRPAVR